MAHKHLLEALDQSLRDITGNYNVPFGGKVIVLAGDFRQILPVVKRGSRADITQAAIKNSTVWAHFRVMRLTENMRINRRVNNAELIHFDNWLERVGNGTIPTCGGDYIELPAQNCITINATNMDTVKRSMTDLIDWVYPDLVTNLQTPGWLASRIIMAPLNIDVDAINAQVLQIIPGDEIVCESEDQMETANEAAQYPIEHLHTLTPSGLPPHRLVFKIGMPLIILRNLNSKAGLCNGTRVILERVEGNSYIVCVIASGAHAGERVLIPRVTLNPNETDFPFKWRRTQFPVRHAFAITINKSQGQDLDFVGVWLEKAVFSHGQLYVCSSRVGDPQKIRYAVLSPPDGPATATRNVVYREILQ